MDKEQVIAKLRQHEPELSSITRKDFPSLAACA